MPTPDSWYRAAQESLDREREHVSPAFLDSLSLEELREASRILRARLHEEEQS